MELEIYQPEGETKGLYYSDWGSVCTVWVCRKDCGWDKWEVEAQ